MKRILLGAVTLGLAVGLLMVVGAFLGSSPSEVSAQPAEPHYKCYDIVGSDPPDTVQLETQFGVENNVAVGQATKLCLPAGKDGSPIPPAEWPHFKCYTIAGQDPPHIVNLTTQFGVENSVAVGQATLLCVPATKTLAPDPPGQEPAPDRHYECFDIVGSDPPDVVDLETQFGLEPGVAVGQATKLCAPALKNGLGDLDAFPHLKCYNIAGDPPQVPPVNLTTQFGIEEGVPVGPPTLLCAPALKTVVGTVGGIAELLATDDGAAAQASTGSGWSAGGYAALAAGLAAAVVVLGTGALYVRRRWLS